MGVHIHINPENGGGSSTPRFKILDIDSLVGLKAFYDGNAIVVEAPLYRLGRLFPEGIDAIGGVTFTTSGLSVGNDGLANEDGVDSQYTLGLISRRDNSDSTDMNFGGDEVGHVRVITKIKESICFIYLKGEFVLKPE